eukprot:TRINITY_DN12755_c0_g1_i1.p1 TRINITY_DN12755_c0_g1~~TRINITY_DN12755_c0_g1_i1.p1  ORF type:complete len:251 (+),score=57.45 TRINITY_DN12755_c0_g1_i1:75-755(+)
MPSTLEAAAHIWDCVNNGHLPHVVVLRGLHEHMTADDIYEVLAGINIEPQVYVRNGTAFVELKDVQDFQNLLENDYIHVGDRLVQIEPWLLTPEGATDTLARRLQRCKYETRVLMPAEERQTIAARRGFWVPHITTNLTPVDLAPASAVSEASGTFLSCAPTPSSSPSGSPCADVLPGVAHASAQTDLEGDPHELSAAQRQGPQGAVASGAGARGDGMRDLGDRGC